MKRHTNFIDRIGERHLSNEGYWMTIVKYFSNRNCTIQFDNGLIIKNIYYVRVKRGEIKNPYHPSVYGVGYNGVGKYIISIGGRHTKAAQTWKGMLERCYDEKSFNKRTTYIGCSVDERWHNFQVFAEWFENSYREAFHLDKDILVKGSKTYSPETCRFVPQEINSLFASKKVTKGIYPTGVVKMGNKFRARIYKNEQYVYLGLFDTPEEAFYVYKISKESWIKEVANKWKDELELDVYESMYNWQVEITD